MWVGLTELVLSGNRTQFRKPVCDGDCALVVMEMGQDLVEPSADLHLDATILAVSSSTGDVRYQRGKSYALQEWPSGPAVWRTPSGQLIRGRKNGTSSIQAEYAATVGRDPDAITWSRETRRHLTSLGYHELRFTITGIRCERLLEMTIGDIVAEGFKVGRVRTGIRSYLDWYANAWAKLHPWGPAMEENPLVWVIHARLEEGRWLKP